MELCTTHPHAWSLIARKVVTLLTIVVKRNYKLLHYGLPMCVLCTNGNSSESTNSAYVCQTERSSSTQVNILRTKQYIRSNTL